MSETEGQVDQRVVVITGVAGFLGQHLARAHLRKGDRVLGVDDFSSGKVDSVTALDDEFPAFSFGYCDLGLPTNGFPATLAEQLDRVDLIYHLASAGAPAVYQREPFNALRANSNGVAVTAMCAGVYNARYVYASSSEVYGDPTTHPQREDYRGRVNPTGPRSMHSEAKRFGEAWVSALIEQAKLSAVSVRIFNTYGPGQGINDGRVIPTFCRAALRGQPIPIHGDGSQTRSFCYVTDTIRGLMLAGSSDYVGPVNIGNPRTEINMVQLAQLICELTDSSSVLSSVQGPRPEDPKSKRPAILLAGTELGWVPEVGLMDGLKQTVDWMARELSNQYGQGPKLVHGRP